MSSVEVLLVGSQQETISLFCQSERFCKAQLLTSQSPKSVVDEWVMVRACDGDGYRATVGTRLACSGSWRHDRAASAINSSGAEPAICLQ